MNKSPDAFRTISEVAELLETPAHVLRFWESRFPQIRPVKRAGGRRYYRPADVALLTGIKRLLHDDGMTIRGVQKILREQGVRFVSGMADDATEEDDDAALEAALAASSGPADVTPPLAPDEAQTAQIIALQTALKSEDAAGTVPKAAPDIAGAALDGLPAPDDGLSPEQGADAVIEAPVAEEALPDQMQSAEPDIEDAPAPTAADHAPMPDSKAAPVSAPAAPFPDLFSRLIAEPPTAPAPEVNVEVEVEAETIDFHADTTPATAETHEAAPEPEQVEDAPMAEWAEPEDHLPPVEAPTIPTLRVTRIGTSAPKPADPLPPKPEDAPEAAAEPIQTIATRLRRTAVQDLAMSDRLNITVIRARARSLRDRLQSAPRSGH